MIRKVALFAEQLAFVFEAAGCEVAVVAPHVMLGGATVGVRSFRIREGRNRGFVRRPPTRRIDVIVKNDNRKPDGSKYFTHLFVGFRPVPLFVRDTIARLPSSRAIHQALLRAPKRAA